jgi:hypothetical protein
MNKVNLSAITSGDAEGGRYVNLTFDTSHLPFIFHFSFLNGQWLTAKSLPIENCKLLIASRGGL